MRVLLGFDNFAILTCMGLFEQNAADFLQVLATGWARFFRFDLKRTSLVPVVRDKKPRE